MMSVEMAAYSKWSRYNYLLLALLALLFLLYWKTFTSMVDIWVRSETFAHGFIIFPISLYLIWRKRQRLSCGTPAISFSGLLAMCVAGFIWLLSEAGDVIVVQQLAFISMILAAVSYVYGWQVVRLLLFPLLFLYFAVPAGEFLIPQLVDFTARFTVAAIKLTGIPVYSVGNHISLPSGDWSVVKACSGIRYLIASITLGTLYAYLTYVKTWKRVVFVLVSAIVPILANGIRAFLIIMIGHYSGMQHAVGVDHLIYGWLFFGLVMLLLFWLGSLFRESQPLMETCPGPLNGEAASGPGMYRVIGSGVIAGLMLTVWPVWAHYASVAIDDDPVKGQTLELPSTISGWQRGRVTADWTPSYSSPDSTQHYLYSSGTGEAVVYIAKYNWQNNESELINSQNRVVALNDSKWRINSTASTFVNYFNAPVREWELESRNGKLLVWRYYYIGNKVFLDDIKAKMYEAVSSLFFRRNNSAAIFVYAEIATDKEQAREILGSFVKEADPHLVISVTGHHER